MSLGLYKNSTPESLISETNVFAITFDGRNGGLISKKLYLRNDNTAEYYTNISISALDPSAPSLVNNSKPGWYWKLAQKDSHLTLDEWTKITAGNVLSLSQSLGTSIKGDIVTYLPVWVQVGIPENQLVKTIKDIVFKVSSTVQLI